MIKKLLITLFILALATSAYAFTPPTSEYSADAYTKLLIHASEADGTAGTDIIDSETTPKTITAVGNAQVDTAQYKFATGSVLFDGTGDYLTLDDNADWYWDGDYTVDFQMRLNTVKSCTLFSQNVDGTHRNEFFVYDAGGGVFYLWLQQYSVAEGNFQTNIITEILADTWYHIALERSGTNYYIFKNGTQIKTVSDATANENLAAAFNIGSGSLYGDLDGWIDEFRVSKGVARDWAPPDTGDVMIIRYVKNFINDLNPDKIGTPMWSCKIKLMCWWRNLA